MVSADWRRVEGPTPPAAGLQSHRCQGVADAHLSGLSAPCVHRWCWRSLSCHSCRSSGRRRSSAETSGLARPAPLLLLKNGEEGSKSMGAAAQAEPVVGPQSTQSAEPRIGCARRGDMSREAEELACPPRDSWRRTSPLLAETWHGKAPLPAGLPKATQPARECPVPASRQPWLCSAHSLGRDPGVFLGLLWTTGTGVSMQGLPSSPLHPSPPHHRSPVGTNLAARHRNRSIFQGLPEQSPSHSAD